MELTIPNLKPEASFKLNPEFVGYFRVHYSPEDLDRLCTSIQNKELEALDRLNILNDVFSLISAGKASSTDGLKLLEAFKDEDSYVVWNSISNAINSLNTILLDQPCYEKFKRFCLDLFSKIKTKVSWDGKADEGHLDTLLRCIVLSKLGRFGDSEVNDEAKRRFDAHVAGTTSIHADMRSTVYSCVGALGQASDYETMIKLHNTEELSEEKDRIIRAGLAGFLNKELLEKAVNFGFSPEVRPQDSPFLLMSVARNPMGKGIAWQFYKDNLPEIRKRYEPGPMIPLLVKAVSEKFTTEDMASTITKYFEENPVQGAERNLAQALETVRVNAAWLERDLTVIKTYLDKY